MSRRDEIRARLDAATPGPWRCWDGWGPTASGRMAMRAIGQEPTNPDGGGVRAIDVIGDADLYATRADAELIAHAPTDLRDLLAVVDTVWDAHADHADQSYRKTCATCAALARLDAVTGR